MKRLSLFCILLFFLCLPGYAQTGEKNKIRRNAVYLETYLIRHDFSQGFVSADYERTLGKKDKAFLRVGLYPDLETAISIPLTFTWITSPQSRHHFEYGIGGVFRIEHYVDPYSTTDREWFYDVAALMIPLMYRYQGNSNWFFRGGFNVFVSWPTLPSPSFSVGYKF